MGPSPQHLPGNHWALANVGLDESSKQLFTASPSTRRKKKIMQGNAVQEPYLISSDI